MTVDADTQQTNHEIGEPEKLIRIAAMAKFMLEEARTTPCDQEGCERFRRIYERTLHELGALLPDDLKVELVFLTVTFEKASPTPSELQIAQAELVGWLEGLFNGIAAATMSTRGDAERAAESIVETAQEADDRPMPGQYL